MRASSGHQTVGAALLAAVLVAGCAGGGAGTLDAPPVATAREITIPEVRVAGGEQQLALTLGVRVGPGAGQAAPMLRVEIRYTGVTRLYDTARDAQGRVLKTERAGGEGCKAGAACAETVRIDLPDAELRQAKATGYRLKLFARNGPEIEIGIPGGQIAALYERVDGAGASRTAARKGS